MILAITQASVLCLSMQKMQGAIPISSGVGFRVYPFIQEDAYASNHRSCSQSFGPLLLFDYIAARNIYGYQNGILVVGTTHMRDPSIIRVDFYYRRCVLSGNSTQGDPIH